MARTPTPSNPNSDTPELTAEDEVVMREIDEAVRKDDAAEFMRNYGVPLGSALAVILLGLAGYLFWDSQVESGLEADSEQLVSVLDYAQAEDFASVKDRTQPLLDAETVGVRTAARLLQAAASLETSEPDRAVELYAQVAADAEAPQGLRDLATLREVTTNFDDREPNDVIAKLANLAKPENAFYGSAAELTAIAHLELGNRDEAGTLFAAIAKNEDLPGSLRDRALQMTGQLGVDAVEDVEALLEEQGVAPDGAGAEGAPGGAGPAQ
ncbi:MAG: tetratricopeptide repeat protein [Pseudomonadota bacterium]